jgi:lipopolysaccharide export system permease protein
MFMLVMQFLWKYIDDLMGKGLDTWIILELLFYVSASLLPLALPLAILLSSIIILGNLGEQNELTALKSSGMSIYRIVRPLVVIVSLIAVGTFYFANYVIPVANFKWHSIIYDIQETKLSAFLKPGAYTQEIDGFSIKIKEGQNNTFKQIIIHDRRDPSGLKTVTADSGEFFRSVNGDFLFFKLYHGEAIEELSNQPTLAAMTEQSSASHRYYGRKTRFASATYKMNLTGFQLNRSQDEMFKNDFEMLNVFQINETVDSLKRNYKEVTDGFVRNSLSKHPYFQATNYKPVLTDSTTIFHRDSIPVVSLESLSSEDYQAIYAELQTQLRTKINSLDNQQEIEYTKELNLRKFEIEFHRKFSLSFSIIVLFFIGAPLGAIVKKGGFGAPVVIAALLFMIYFVLISIGDSMAKENIITPFWGMWGPSFILTPFAFILMRAAARDKDVRSLFSIHLQLPFGKKK